MKLKTQIVLTTHLVLIIASVVFGAFTYKATKRVFMNELDARLMAAASMTRDTLPEDYQENIQGSDSVDSATYGEIVTKASKLAEGLGLQYLFTMKLVDGKPVYTSVSSLKLKPEIGDYPAFFSVPENPDVFVEALSTMRSQNLDVVLAGRRLRVALYPFWADGVPCLSGAGMDKSYMISVYRDVVSQVAIFCLLAMLLAMLIDFYLVRAISRPMENLTPTGGSNCRSASVSSGADEIRVLADNINKMSEAINTTVTQCRDVEKSLRASEHKYRFLTEHTTDVIWSLDEYLRFDYISPSDEKFRGFTSEEVLGTPFWECIEPAEFKRMKGDHEFISTEWETIKNGGSRTYELHLIRQAGDPILAEVTVTAYLDAAGVIRGYHGKVHDIRERRRLEEERSKVERLQSIGTLAGGIAHDFNNILMGLFGNIELAKDLLDVDSHAHELLDEAGRSMNRAVRLTKQLLVFSKGGDPQKDSNVDIAALVSEVAEFDLSGSNVKLCLSKDSQPYVTAVDRGQIEQVVSNIVINARQAMRDGGSVSISVENILVKEGQIQRLSAGNYIQVTIRDQGPGIPIEIQKRIFEPYFTTKSMGSGLGLATAYSIVVKHGGSLEVCSKKGEGAAFTFYLPVVERCSSQDPDIKKESQELLINTNPARKSGGVLIMDDEVLICALLKKMLGLEGVHVETAANAATAVTLYKQALAAGNPFACAILDLTISGGIGGAEVVQELRSLDPEIFAIASSGYADSAVMSECRKHGFDTVIAKPYSRTEVLKLLERIGVIKK